MYINEWLLIFFEEEDLDMSNKDLFPHLPNESKKRRFHHSTNRKEEIILQQELNDVAKKSINQINAFKEARKNVPLSEEEANARYIW